MAPCVPAQQHTGESLVFLQTDEVCSRTISNTIHMDIWGLGFLGFFFLRLEPGRTCVYADMVLFTNVSCFTGAGSKQTGRSRHSVWSRGQSSSVLLFLLCLERCRYAAQPLSWTHVSHDKTTTFKQNIYDLVLMRDAIQGGEGGSFHKCIHLLYICLCGGLSCTHCSPAPTQSLCLLLFGDILVPVFQILNSLKLWWPGRRFKVLN